MCTDAKASSLDIHLCRIAEGDQQALRALYDDTSPALFALSLRFMGGREAAEDLLQEVYLLVWRKAGRFDPQKGEAMAWLRAILRNKALDVLRRQASMQTVALPRLDTIVDPSPSPLVILEDRTVGRQIENRLATLQTRYARALRAIYFEGLSYRRLAERERIPIATAKTWVHRALLVIRRSSGPDAFTGWNEDEPRRESADVRRPCRPLLSRSSTALHARG